MNTKKLLFIILAMGLGVLSGALTGTTAGLGAVTYFQLYDLVGRLFLNALSLVVVPLVISSIITGTYRLASEHGFKGLGARVLCFFVGTNAIATCVGIVAALWFEPGVGKSTVGKAILLENPSLFDSLSQLLLRAFPSNIIAAAAEGQILGIILFSLVFGFCLSKIEHEYQTVVVRFWQGLLQVMMQITHLIMKALPIGIFALVARAIAETGLSSVAQLGSYFLVVLGTIAFYGFVILPFLVTVVGKTSAYTHLRTLFPAMITAFTTASSAASIPVTLECTEKTVRPRVARFVIPLGVTLNLSGSAVFIAVATITIAQAYGVALTIPTLITIGVMGVVATTGMAGIPSASVISVLMIMHVIGLPAEGIGLILAVDRIVDMARTSITVWGNSCCAVMANRYEAVEVHEATV